MYCEGKLKLMSHNTGRYTLYPGADRGFQVRGGGCKICWGISCEKSRFPILGDTCTGCTPSPPLDPPLLSLESTPVLGRRRIQVIA